jgi:ParB-like chromosome segregation protein Spo0J
MSDMKFGFELRTVRLPLADILPLRQIKDPATNIRRYRTIRASIKEVGLVEPLVVHPLKGTPGKYQLLDGHLRLHALKDLGHTEADCIISIDDESFTYNARVNRLNPIAEHKMIMKAVQNGVPPQRIAAALNLDISEVKASMTLLDGINAEAADLLKDKPVSPKAIRLLRKVTGVRQIEIVELMVSTNNYTTPYAEALVLATPKDQLLSPDHPKQKAGMTREEIARLQVEMESLEHDIKAIEGGYAENNLVYTCARGHIKKLLENTSILRFLSANYADLLAEFQSIVASETL